MNFVIFGRDNVNPHGASIGEAFFQAFDRDRRTLARQMAAVRYVTKLYALRNDGRFPTDHFEQGEGDFFGDDESFLDSENDDFSF